MSRDYKDRSARGDRGRGSRHDYDRRLSRDHDRFIKYFILLVNLLELQVLRFPFLSENLITRMKLDYLFKLPI